MKFNSAFTSTHYLKWFFECKHYSKGVPTEELNSKIAWADAENPDFLVVLTTSYITTSAKQWLDKIQSQKNYQIIIIEGEEIKTRLTTNQHLIPKYFSGNKYINLYQDIVRHNNLYNIYPSLDVLNEIISNIPSTKFQLNDLGFLLSSFFQCIYREKNNGIQWEQWSRHIRELPYPLFEQIKNVSTQTDLSIYFKDYDFLAGSGFIDDSEYEEEEATKYYQDYVVHMNFSVKAQWQTGYYLIAIINKKEAFEIFMPSSKDFETYSFYHSNYDEHVLNNILSKYCSDERIKKVKRISKAIL